MSREKILIRTSWVSTIGNAILSASKIIVGLFAGSLAVLGDGIDSATDVIISIVMIFTARIMNRPPSKKYVFGYEKAEGIATKILSLVIFYAGVLVGLVFTFIFKLPILDSITGLIISLFIIKSSVSIFIDSNVELMDGVKDVNVYNKIFEAVEEVPGASNPHRVRSRMIGNLYMITLDIEVNPQITITQAHEIAESVEKSIKSSIDNVYDILVHVEPAGECQTNEKFGIDKDMVEKTINKP